MASYNRSITKLFARRPTINNNEKSVLFNLGTKHELSEIVNYRAQNQQGSIFRHQIRRSSTSPLPYQRSSARYGSIATMALLGGCAGLWWLQEKEAERKVKSESRGISNFFRRGDSTPEKKSQTSQIVEFLQDRDKNFICSRENVDEGRWWVLITATFAHGSWLHLGFNMLGLYSLGPHVIRTAGYLGFGIIWTVAGISGGALRVYWPEIRKQLPHDVAYEIGNFLKLDRDSQIMVRSLGASGSLCGLFGFLAAIHPAFFLQGALIQVGFDVYCLTTDAFSNLGTIRIGHEAHLAGTATGALLGLGAVLLTRGRIKLM
ncbi:hypothetical protein HYFRA_00011212 [Hymenoscyphus fraxineus]|uniref:Peptidase S54 rhomboid domain-containing protein n=1 Tax=Hymenoscyphus fraxineus TaxID=746836 RepID=A0A9N9L219_9HELO|nr:hypothetical protein HYFRA_00011212 [Hymenoscyphus fraxineus]